MKHYPAEFKICLENTGFLREKQNRFLIPALLVVLSIVFPWGGEPAIAAAPVESLTADPASVEGGLGRIDYFRITMSALAGLVLFIYGVTRLAQGLEFVAGERMRSLVGKFTSNRFAGVLTGMVATTALESSSVTIIMVIAMVSAGILSFVQSLGVALVIGFLPLIARGLERLLPDTEASHEPALSNAESPQRS